MNKDPLEYIALEKWTILQEVFQSDWPRGVSGYIILNTQREWMQKGMNYGFKVLCPYGDPWNGMVAINVKDKFYEIVIQCPKDDTSKLEEALRQTKAIDWTRNIIVPFAPSNVIKCITQVVEELNVEIELILPSESFILNKRTPTFEDISLPQDVSFGLLSKEHAHLVDSKWHHRYPESIWYFQLLISSDSGFGLFKNENLISWTFINEAGNLGHMYTLEEYRRQGYAELLLKLVCNNLLEDGKDVLAFCVKGNTSACNLYKKVGFKHYDCGVAWCYLKKKNLSGHFNI